MEEEGCFWCDHGAPQAFPSIHSLSFQLVTYSPPYLVLRQKSFSLFLRGLSPFLC